LKSLSKQMKISNAMKTKNAVATISLIWAVTLSAYPQSAPNWMKTYGGNAMELASCICPAPNGGYLVGGTSASDCSEDKSDCLRGVIDYWVIRVDEDGNKLWDRTYGGDTFDELTTIQATTDGGFLLGGSSTSGVSGDKSEPSFGEYDYWVVKIDATGSGAVGPDLRWRGHRKHGCRGTGSRWRLRAGRIF